MSIKGMDYMVSTMRYPLILAGILIIAVFLCGCSDQSGSGTATPAQTTAALQPKFVAGDIIAKTPASTDTFWLIVKYDPKTDKYERALVFKSLQQTWFRTDSRTETAERTLTEKVYPVKIFHAASVSAIPVRTPTPVVTMTSTISGPAPDITGITPNYGMVGSSVGISNLAGQNFQPGATVKLIDAGGSAFIASSVLATDTKITCTFYLSGATAGKANVVVTNPDGQSATLINGFTINEPGPVITAVTPSEGAAGQIVPLTIIGSNFKVPATVLFTNLSAEIKAENVQVHSETQITCVIRIPMSTAPGLWSITVRNVIDKQNGTALNKFTITSAT
jgi:hypothetical protein